MILLAPALAFAQPTSERRVEVGAGLHWLVGMNLGDVNANETAFGGATRPVFTSSSRFGQAACPEGRASVELSRSIEAEGSLAFCRTHLMTTLSQDPEAAGTTVSESLTEYLVEGGIAAHLARWRRARGMPFVSAGGGYMRQVHEGHVLVEGGGTLYAGGGLRYPLKADTVRGWMSAAFRVEVRATILTGTLTPRGGAHVLPTVIAGVSFHP